MTLTRRTVLGIGRRRQVSHRLRPARRPAAADDTIKIGAPFNVTGALSSLDAPALNGAKWRSKEINDAGGVLGKKLELVVYDTKTDPTVIAATAASSSTRTRCRSRRLHRFRLGAGARARSSRPPASPS